MEKVADGASPILIRVDIVPLKVFGQRRDNDFGLHAAGRQRKQFDVVIEGRRDDERDSLSFSLGGHYEPRCWR